MDRTPAEGDGLHLQADWLQHEVIEGGGDGPDGFEITFVDPVDTKTAADTKSYNMRTFTYIYQADYGSPEVDITHPTIDKAVVAPDGKSVRLYVSKLEEGHIHELIMDGVRSSAGLPLLHKEAYYTLNYFAH